MIFVKYVLDRRGSTLILLVMTVAVTIMLGVSLMSITLTNYKIKKVNNEASQALYMAEYGFNNSYAKTYTLVNEAVTDSINKAEEYLNEYPENAVEAENIFIDNYKLYITDRISNEICDSANPYVDIYDMEHLIFDAGCLTMRVKSKYVSKNNVVKLVAADIIVNIPDYNESINGTVDCSLLISFRNWKISNN